MTNNYASFKIRFLASLLDGILFLLLIAGLFYYVSLQPTLPQAVSAIFLSLIILLNPLFLFSSIIFTYYLGGSPGKLLTGLRITSEDEKKLSLKKILFRQTIGYSFSWIFFGLGYLSIIKDPKKQAWHDKTVGSVIKAKGNMLIVGIAVYILLVIATISILATSYNIFSKGSLMIELRKLSEKTSSSSSTDTNKSSCIQYGGNWLDRFHECESPNLDGYRNVCRNNGGIFYECESPCRYNSKIENCIEACMQVCKY